MRRVVIIGAGHAGLQLGIGLRRHGYDVKIFTNRSATAVRNGPVMSSQLMFGHALEAERTAMLNFWDVSCPAYSSVAISIADRKANAFCYWESEYDPPAQSVDQRVKLPRWMELFEEIGGDLRITNVELDDLNEYARNSDLLIIASGRTSLSGIFPKVISWSPYDAPMRATTMLYVTPPEMDRTATQGGLAILPDIGEIVWFPAISIKGPCFILGFGAVIDGPLDVFRQGSRSSELLGRGKESINKYVLTQRGLWDTVELNDANGTLTGAITPYVRDPVGFLEYGRPVLGIGDAVVLNDPIAAQGANNASKTAQSYQQLIIDRGDRPFNEEWMRTASSAIWEELHWSVELSNAFLGRMPGHVQDLFVAAIDSAALRRKILCGFDSPASLIPWLSDPDLTKKFILEMR